MIINVGDFKGEEKREISLALPAQIAYHNDMSKHITMTDNPIAAKDPERYTLLSVNTKRAVKSYQLSLLGHEVLHSDGRLKGIEDLSERQATLRASVLEQIEKGEPLPRPVAGIGINDNFELGAGRDVFMTLASLGHSTIEVHVRQSQLKELEEFKS